MRARRSPASLSVTIQTRLTALGFAIGGAAHAISLLLLSQGIAVYGTDYPWWRHLTMASVDAGVSRVASAVMAPQRLTCLFRRAGCSERLRRSANRYFSGGLSR